MTRPATSHDIVTRLLPMLRATSDHTIELTSPLDGAHIAHLPISSDGDMAEAFDRARAAKQEWQSVSISERSEMSLVTIAVEDIARAPPRAIAACQEIG